MKISNFEKAWKNYPLLFFDTLHEKVISTEESIKIEIEVLKKVLERIPHTFQPNIRYLLRLKTGVDELRCMTLYKHQNVLGKIAELFKKSIQNDPEIAQLKKKFDYVSHIASNHIIQWKQSLRVKFTRKIKDNQKKKDKASTQIRKWRVCRRG
jgi:hypothetical protein